MKIRNTIISLRFKDIQTAAEVENAIQQLRFLFAQDGRSLTAEEALYDFLLITCQALHKQKEDNTSKIILD